MVLDFESRGSTNIGSKPTPRSNSDIAQLGRAPS